MNIHRETRAAASRNNSGAAHSSVACGATSPNLGLLFIHIFKRVSSFSSSWEVALPRQTGELGGGKYPKGEVVGETSTSGRMMCFMPSPTTPPSGHPSSQEEGNLSYSFLYTLKMCIKSSNLGEELSDSDTRQQEYPGSPSKLEGVAAELTGACVGPAGALQSLQISAADPAARYKGFNFLRRSPPPVTKPPIFAVGADRTLQSPRFPAADATARYKGANPPRRRFCNPLRPLKRNSIHF